MKTDILRRKARFVREVVFAPFKSHINKTLNNCGWLIAYGSKEEELYDLYKDIDKWKGWLDSTPSIKKTTTLTVVRHSCCSARQLQYS